MKRTWTITLLQHEQPSDAVWREIRALVDAWNERHTVKFSPVMDFMWQISFDSQPELEPVLQELDTLKRTIGAAYHLAGRRILEEDDYGRADFVEILGVDLGTESRPLLINEATALEPLGPCPECGWQDVFDQEQTQTLVIDERQLTTAARAEGGWDLVNLPNGQKMVSDRMARLLRKNRVEGYQLCEVIDGARGRPSKRMFQLIARRAILTPCPEHTRVHGRPFCPSCGTAYGELEGHFWVKRDWIGDDEVISRHRLRGAMLYVSRRVYERLVSAKLRGIHRNDVLGVCQHS